MDDVIKTEKWIDTMKWFNYLTFDIIADLTFGEPIGMVEKGSDRMEMVLPDGSIYDEEIIKLVDYVSPFYLHVSVRPNTLNSVNMLLPSSAPCQSHTADFST